ncbi:P-loop containing nucleoside triphosphate hydrolase protein [Plenodomus tracheiphilus IPT5]|uniref:P-loop containing nucleoside triphosphate hydrolase protein n=1 Tax=Plenodomus tracheiphilus IPT5 TaxID=1408161 RepID=A0A6A7ATT4_9PLEO|nr:P-loop containing nucleoside triphosphate hydrolase protein [Plenodomus tracheiphilus IPT5]
MGLTTMLDGVRILVLGEAGVGKTCFTDMFLKGDNFIYHHPFDEIRRRLPVNGKEWPLRPMDISSTMLREPGLGLDETIFNLSFAKSEGIILLYDITSRTSFDLVTQDAYIHALSTRHFMSTNNPNWGKRCGFVLVGNKVDITTDSPGTREVEREMAEEWAQSQGFRHIEVSSKNRAAVDEAMVMLVTSIEVARRRDERDKAAKKEARSKARRPSLKSRIRSTFVKSTQTSSVHGQAVRSPSL